MIHCQESFGAFVTLGGLPPRRQVVARELPRCSEPREVCEGCALPPQGKKPIVKKLNLDLCGRLSEERVERDPTRVGAS